jgi:hypothetical protein
LPTNGAGLAIGGSSSCCENGGEPSGINRIYRLYREEGPQGDNLSFDFTASNIGSPVTMHGVDLVEIFVERKSLFAKSRSRR